MRLSHDAARQFMAVDAGRDAYVTKRLIMLGFFSQARPHQDHIQGADMPRIQTTVVGSYPVPDWLVAAPSEQALIDATRVVIATQEEAGIDVVCDGELYRFDINHPETNGMIEYFVRPMDGVGFRMSFEERIAYRNAEATRFRTRPPGVVEGALGSGSLDLPLACRREGAHEDDLQVHRHRPAHAG